MQILRRQITRSPQAPQSKKGGTSHARNIPAPASISPDTNQLFSKLVTAWSASIRIVLGAEANPDEMFATLANRITYGTEELTPGVSPLATGAIYVQYE